MTLADEAQLYLAVVVVFRAEGCEPRWRPEPPPRPIAPEDGGGPLCGGGPPAVSRPA
jgi:hypothetical protein